MIDLKKLKADAAADFEIARARQSAIDLIAGLVSDLKGMGYSPEIDEVDDLDRPMLQLRVDLNAIINAGQAKPATPKEKPSEPVEAVEMSQVLPLPKIIVPEPKESHELAAKASPGPAAEIGEDGLTRGRWTEAEDDLLIALVLDGLTNPDIADRLKRPLSAVTVRRYKTLADRIKDCQREVEEDEPVQLPAAAQDEDEEGFAAAAAQKVTGGPAPIVEDKPVKSVPIGGTAPPFANPGAGGVSAAERAISAHLNVVGYAGQWSPEIDLALAEGLARGDGAGAVAADIGFEKSDVVDRWARINTDRGSIDHQSRLIKVLRQRVETQPA